MHPTLWVPNTLRGKLPCCVAYLGLLLLAIGACIVQMDLPPEVCVLIPVLVHPQAAALGVQPASAPQAAALHASLP